MEFRDIILLLHPVFTIVAVFPLIGTIVNRALQTRQRRLETLTTGKSKIPPVVGSEHVQLGRWLTGFVVGTVLAALGNDILGNIIDNHVWDKVPFQVIFIVLLFLATIASLYFLYQTKTANWRIAFATLTGIGLVVLGCQNGVYWNTEHWYMSHYYYGITAALLMIFSLAIVPDIYKDKTNRWRKIHIALNTLALLIFIAQGITGARSLLEIPLAWQEPYVNKLYEQHCDIKPCTVMQTSPLPQKSH
jgi:membrane protein YdbS with pleckstrin-like domain